MTAIAVGASTPIVTSHEGQPITTSQDVAAFFGKQHGHVVRAIRRLLEAVGSERESIFGLTFHRVPGPNGSMRTEDSYRMTRDGFTLLAMGFTGRRALEFKLAYIDAFNRMEAQLKAPAPAPKALEIVPESGTPEWAQLRLQKTFYRSKFLTSIDEFTGQVSFTPIPDNMILLDWDNEEALLAKLRLLPPQRAANVIKTLTDTLIQTAQNRRLG